MYDNVVKSYQQANFFTADPLKLVIMCYDGAISSLKQACESYTAKDYPAKGRAVRKALDILHELNASLDMEKGGEIAGNLRALYLFMTQAVTEADLKRDLEVFGRVIHMLEELEAQWKDLSAGRSRNVRPLPDKIPPPEAARQTALVSRAWSA
jgi:flagellar secretion chaperone FliS